MPSQKTPRAANHGCKTASFHNPLSNPSFITFLFYTCFHFLSSSFFHFCEKSHISFRLFVHYAQNRSGYCSASSSELCAPTRERQRQARFNVCASKENLGGYAVVAVASGGLSAAPIEKYRLNGHVYLTFHGNLCTIIRKQEMKPSRKRGKRPKGRSDECTNAYF